MHTKHIVRRRSAVATLLSTFALLGASVGLAARADANPICTGSDVQYSCIGEVEPDGSFLRCDVDKFGPVCAIVRPPWGQEVWVLR